MLFRKLKEEDYNRLQTNLLTNARSKPLCPIYEVDLVFNGEAFTLFVQPDKRSRLNVLYALRTVHGSGTQSVSYEMITQNNLLTALSELMIYQLCALNCG